MRGPETILVGVDGSPRAVEAVRWAAMRASKGRARLWLVHASTPVGLSPGVPVAPLVPMTEAAGLIDVEAQDRIATARLEAAADVVRDVDVPIDVVVTTQDVAADALLERAAEASLIVVGSHGHGGLAGLVLGSTSQAVLRQASCPVAVLRVNS